MSELENKLLTIITQLHEVVAELPKSPSVAPETKTLPETPPEPESPVEPQAAPDHTLLSVSHRQSISQALSPWIDIRQALAAANAELEKLPADEPNVKAVHARLGEIENELNGLKPADQLMAGIRDEISQALGNVSELVDQQMDVEKLQDQLNAIRTIAFEDQTDGIEGGTDVAGDVTGVVGK